MVETDTWKFQARLSRVEICGQVIQGLAVSQQPETWDGLPSEASHFPARASSFSWLSKARAWLDASNLVLSIWVLWRIFNISNLKYLEITTYLFCQRLCVHWETLCQRAVVAWFSWHTSTVTVQPACHNIRQTTCCNRLHSFSILSVAIVFVMAAYIVAEYVQIIAIHMQYIAIYTMPHCSAACDLIWHDMPDILFLLCIIRMIRSDTTHMNHIEVFQVFGVKTPFSSFHEVLALWQISFLRMKIHGVSWSLCRDEGDPNLVLFSPVWFIPSSWNSAVEAWNFGGFSIDKGARFSLICLCCRGLANDPCSTKLRHSWISEWSLQCPGTFDEMWIDVIRFERFQRHCSALVVFVGWGIGDSFTSSFSKIQEATIIIHHTIVFWEPWLLIVGESFAPRQFSQICPSTSHEVQ